MFLSSFPFTQACHPSPNHQLPSSLPWDSRMVSWCFLFLGAVADRSVYFLAEGDADVSLQLGGVAVLSGGFWEVGRLATGEKGGTRAEIEREDRIEKEFEEFADKKIDRRQIHLVGAHERGGQGVSEVQSQVSRGERAVSPVGY